MHTQSRVYDIAWHLSIETNAYIKLFSQHSGFHRLIMQCIITALIHL